jgi:hypothetical protein
MWTMKLVQGLWCIGNVNVDDANVVGGATGGDVPTSTDHVTVPLLAFSYLRQSRATGYNNIRISAGRKLAVMSRWPITRTTDTVNVIYVEYGERLKMRSSIQSS